MWDGEFSDYQPKGHANIRYNHSVSLRVLKEEPVY
jgi:hypothetical protein